MLRTVRPRRAGRAGAGKRPLTPDMAMAVVGGINELVLQYIEQDRVRDLGELVQPASRLLLAVAGAPAD